jgi:hypothetical protein
MAQHNHTPRLAATEEAVIVLFCLIDDAYYYAQLNPSRRRHESLKRLSSDSEVRRCSRSHLPSTAPRHVESALVLGRRREVLLPSILLPSLRRRDRPCAPSSLHRRVRKLRRFLEPLGRNVVAELIGDPETLVVDSTLLSRCWTRGRSGSRRVSMGPRG